MKNLIKHIAINIILIAVFTVFSVIIIDSLSFIGGVTDWIMIFFNPIFFMGAYFIPNWFYGIHFSLPVVILIQYMILIPLFYFLYFKFLKFTKNKHFSLKFLILFIPALLLFTIAVIIYPDIFWGNSEK